MSWETAYVVTRSIDEPAEGGELAWEETPHHGERLTPRTDTAWRRCPRAPLSQGDVVAATLTVTPEVGAWPLTVEDHTDKQGFTLPSSSTVHLRRREGLSFDETYLYFHPCHEGRVVYADYEYYAAEATVHGFAGAGVVVMFCETGSGKWKKLNGSSSVGAGLVKPGERGVNAVVAGDGGELWALTSDAGVLSRYGKRFSGWLDCAGAALPGKEYLGYLAQACLADVTLKPDGRLVFGAGRRMAPHVIPPEAVVDWEEETGGSIPITVRLAYRDGDVRSGKGPLIHRYRNPLITNKKHAQIVCDDLRARLSAAAAAVVAGVTEDHYLSPGRWARVGKDARSMGTYLVTAAGRDLSRRTARLEMVRNAGGGVGYELD